MVHQWTRKSLEPIWLAALGALFSPGARAGEPGPRDLIDVARIQDLDLEDLGWQEEVRRLEGDVLVVGGSFTGPRLEGFTAGLEVFETDLQEFATVYIPRWLAEGAEVHEVVLAAHYAPLARTLFEPILRYSASLPVSFIVHGEEEEDWVSQGHSSRDALVAMSLLALATANRCEPRDYRFGNYLLALAETNLRALTLQERLLEAEGYRAGRAGILGYSKEGFAAWLASAVDDRISAAAPGGWQLENIVRGLSAEEESWGCEGSIGGAAGGEELLALRNWLVGSPGGRRALEYFSVDRFAGDLYPGFFLIHGDVGLHDLHDGIYYSPGAETDFLESFASRPHRYDRRPDRGERESDEAWNARLAGILCQYLIAGDLSVHPRIDEARLERQDRLFRVVARVGEGPDAVRLWWSHSPERAFDDPGNVPWTPVPMARSAEAWISPWVEPPEGESLGWYVEAERTGAWEGFELTWRDASPQRFLHPTPPLSCPGVSVPDCVPFLRSDANLDGAVDVSDAVTVLAFLFTGSVRSLGCEDAADADDDGSISVTDAIYLLNYLFLGGPAPREPWSACGLDSRADALGCEVAAPCGLRAEAGEAPGERPR